MNFFPSAISGLVACCLLFGYSQAASGGIQADHSKAKDSKQKFDPLVLKVWELYLEKGKSEALGFWKQNKKRLKQDRISFIIKAFKKKGGRSALIAKINQLGGSVQSESKNYLRIELPPSALGELETHPDIHLFSSGYPHQLHAPGLGDSVSEALDVTGARIYQEQGILGQGIRVGVIDFGFIGLAAAKAAGELPSSAVSINLAGGSMESVSDHGTVVAEHVMDMVPSALLYLFKIDDIVDFENAKDSAASLGIRVLNLSLGWYLVSYYDGTGQVNDIVNDSRTNDGIFWAVSAGNEADRHWRGSWVDGDNDDYLNFSGGDERLAFSGTGSVFLNWNQYSAANTDLDLYVYDKNNALSGSSTVGQNGSPNQSWEAVQFSYDPSLAPYSIRVRRFSGSTSGLNMTLFVGGGQLDEYRVAGHSMTDPATASGSFTVGAMAWYEWSSSSPPIRPFSSRGRTNGGALKPDITGPDGTRNFHLSNFTGTSFAAPVVGGAAALLMSEDPTRTAAKVESLLIAWALDTGPAGKDSVFGWGRVKLSTAHLNRAPVLTPIGNATLQENVSYKWVFSATDPDGDTLNFQMTGTPTGAVFIDSGNNRASMIWTPTYQQAGSYPITVTVEDDSLSDQETFTLTVQDVNVSPVITSQAKTLDMNEDDSLTLDLTAVTVVDDDDPSGPFTLKVYAGTNYLFLGNRIAPLTNFNGPLAVNVRVFDEKDSSNSFALLVSVAAVNDAPVISAQAELNALAGFPFPVSLNYFGFSDPDNTFPDDFILVLKSGSNYTLSDTVVTPSSSYEGDITVPTIIYDGKDSSNEFSTVIHVVRNDPPIFSTTQDSMTNQVVRGSLYRDTMRATDPDGDSLQYFLIAAAPGMALDSLSGVVTWTPQSGQEGIWSLAAVAWDGLALDTLNFQITVLPLNEAPLFTTTPGDMYGELMTGSLYRDTMRATDSDGDLLKYFLLAGAAGMSLDSLSGILTWTPQPGQEGLWTPRAIVWDGWALDTLDFQIAVLRFNTAPVFTTAPESLFAQLMTGSLYHDTMQAIDGQGDILKYFLLAGAAGMSLDSLTGNLTWTPQPGQEGLWSLRAVAWDGSALDTLDFQIAVLRFNRPPVIDSLVPVGDTTILEGDSLLYRAYASDPDSGDSLVYGWYVNDTLLSLQSQFNYKTDFLSAGGDTLEIRVSDGDSVLMRRWAVTVLNRILSPVVEWLDGRLLGPDSLLSWNPPTDPELKGPIYYKIEISLDSGFQTILSAADSMLDTQIVIRALLNDSMNWNGDTLIYWRLRAVDSLGVETETSRTLNFLLDVSQIVSQIKKPPQQFFVGRNHPNPFQDRTTFIFGIPTSGNVSIHLFDILGKHLNKISLGALSAGEHRSLWRGSFGPGVYFYQVEWNGLRSPVQKMIQTR